VNCDAMFRPWREILQAGTPWKRLFHRKTENLPFWRNAEKKLESNQTTWRTGQYRGVCKDSTQVQRNWITGNFKKFTYHVNRGDHFKLTIGDDCVAWEFKPFVVPKTARGCAFLDTESMEITEIPLYCLYEITDGLLHRSYRNNAGRTVEIWNPKFNLTLTNAEHNDSGFGTICSGSGLLVRLDSLHDLDKRRRMELWKMGNPPTLLRTRTFEDRELEIFKVDQRFIVAGNYFREFCQKKVKSLFFLSTETLEVVGSLSAKNYDCYVYEGKLGEVTPVSPKLMNFECVYDKGLLFEHRGKGLVRIMDVASGTYVNDVRIPFQSKDDEFIKLLDTWVSANSNVIVIGWKYAKGHLKRVSHLSVYDLEAVKNPNSDPGTHLLYTLQFQFDIHSFVMNENEIAFSGGDRYGYWCVTLLKFANFSFAERKSSDLKENPEDDKEPIEKIVQMKVKRMIYEPVDFDTRDANYEDFMKEMLSGGSRVQSWGGRSGNNNT
jgi:hypothetical protein